LGLRLFNREGKVMEIAGLVLMSVAVLLLLHNVIITSQLGEDHSYILRKLDRPSDVGPEGNRDGEVRDLIWIDNSLRKVKWSQAHGSWRLVK
jgi:hypothetical protein